MQGFLGFSLFVALFSAWFTHVVVCIKAGSWGFLIAGAIFAPIGVIHGLMIWLGVV